MMYADRVKDFCLKHELITEGERILLAVSGGPDSAALLHIFQSLRPELKVKTAIVHLEHGLRGHESLSDQRFVKKLSEEFGVEFYTKNIDVKKERMRGESLEEAARRVRYLYFHCVLQEYGFDRIATGHNQDDNIETIIFRLLKGTGPSGFVGIQPKQGVIIHPLLCLRRDEIENFLSHKKITYRIDTTNFDTSIVRNKIRYKIIPTLGNIDKNYHRHILNLVKITQEENIIINEITDKVFRQLIIEESDAKITLDYSKFLSIKDGLKRRIIIKALERLTQTSSNFRRQYVSFQMLEKLTKHEERANKFLYYNELYVIRKEYSRLIFQKRVVNGGNTKYLYKVERDKKSVYIKEIQKSITFEKKSRVQNFDAHKLYFDNDLLQFPLNVRNRRDGDRIQLKNCGTKKIKAIFVDEKVPRDLREHVPLVVSNKEIVGIFCSMYGKANRVAMDYMISEHTKSVMVCELS
jgi:tRNA(Ile)-lysidine synthase